MVKRIKKAKLGRKASHKRLLVRNLLRSLFTNGYLTTTTIKAKALRDAALKLMNSLKKNSSLSALKAATVTVGGRELVEKIVKHVKANEPKLKLVKIGYRDGDKAETTRISIIGYSVKEEKKTAEKKQTKKEEKKEVKQAVKGPRAQEKQVKGKLAIKRERSRTRSGL